MNLSTELSKSRLFRNMTADSVNSICESYGELRTVTPGEQLFENMRGSCAVILSGLALIVSGKSKDRKLIRFAGEYDTVGLASLFSDAVFNSSVEASGKDELVAYVLTTDEIKAVMDGEGGSVMRDNLLSYLCDKAAFLAGRLDCITAGSAEQRLASYLLSVSRSDGYFKPDVTMGNLANILNSGRASLYRALESLNEKHLIEYNKNGFRILDRNGLLNLINNGGNDYET